MSLKISLDFLGKKVLWTLRIGRNRNANELSPVLRCSVFTSRWTPSSWKQRIQCGEVAPGHWKQGRSSGFAALEVQESFDSQAHLPVTHLKLEEVSHVGSLDSCPFTVQVVCVGVERLPCSGRWVPACFSHRAVAACSCKSTFSVLWLINDRYFQDCWRGIWTFSLRQCGATGCVWTGGQHAERKLEECTLGCHV